MLFWTILLILMGSVALAGLVFLYFRFRRFRFVFRLSQKKKALGVILPIACVLVVALIIALVLRNVTYFSFNAAIILIHLILFWLIFDLIGRLIHGKFVKGKRPYWQGAAAILATVIYLGCGWYIAHHVVRTDYALKTQKSLGSAGKIRIAQISDSHVGATFHGEEFKQYMLEINEAEPDIVVITGDYVDDDTTYEDMILCGEGLASLNAPVYFVYGNHDRGYYNSRGYGEAELIANLEQNGVIVLRDESARICVDEDAGVYVTIVGREDTSYAMMSGKGRLSAAELLGDVDHDDYIIVLDHEPNDYDAEADAGADLVLCGHTHGGQLFPCGYIGLLIGSNDEFLGLSRRQNTDLIVNSGISDWSIPFKTGCRAEYVIIDVTSANG